MCWASHMSASEASQLASLGTGTTASIPDANEPSSAPGAPVPFMLPPPPAALPSATATRKRSTRLADLATAAAKSAAHEASSVLVSSA